MHRVEDAGGRAGKKGMKAVEGEGATCQPEAEIVRAQEAFRPFFHLHVHSRSAVSNTGFLTATASAHRPFQILHSVVRVCLLSHFSRVRLLQPHGL